MKVVLLSVVFLLIELTSCSQSAVINEIIANENLIISNLSKSSLYGRNGLYLYEIYFSNGVRSYSVSLNGDNCQIMHDTTFLYRNSEDYYLLNDSTLNVCDSFQKLKLFMEEYSIVGYRSDWSSVGISLKIYLDQYEMFYVSSSSLFLNEYKDLVKVNDNWFYRKL